MATIDDVFRLTKDTDYTLNEFGEIELDPDVEGMLRLPLTVLQHDYPDLADEWFIDDKENFDLSTHSSIDYKLMTLIQLDQEGKRQHGNQVAKALSYLCNNGFYDDIGDAYQSTQIEARNFPGGIPDVVDRDNRILLECGFVGRFQDSETAFLSRCLRLAGSMVNYAEDWGPMTDWNFIHLPYNAPNREVQFLHTDLHRLTTDETSAQGPRHSR